MTQWHLRQWCLWPMVVVAMGVLVVNCALPIDAATSILSLVSMAAAKTPSPLPPLTATSMDNDCYCCH
jgi:hypothetical protein